MINHLNYTIQAFHDAPIIDGYFKSRGIDRRRHLHQVMSMIEIDGYVMEFGVYSGKTMWHISGYFQDDTCWGFDSFEGLPEEWIINVNEGRVTTHYGAGHFHLRGYKPDFRDNVQLIKGWFENTLPDWCTKHQGPVKFLHIDCDLYSSTCTILNELNDQIVPGTVIVFDEMYPWEESSPYTEWQHHEYKALGEWLKNQSRAFKPLLRTRSQQCSIMITQ